MLRRSYHDFCEEMLYLTNLLKFFETLGCTEIRALLFLEMLRFLKYFW